VPARPDATAAFVEAATEAAAPARKAALRVRRAATPQGDDAPG